jgi:hypothetical protein
VAIGAALLAADSRAAKIATALAAVMPVDSAAEGGEFSQTESATDPVAADPAAVTGKHFLSFAFNAMEHKR